MKAKPPGVPNERLRRARQQRGWSQDHLAELLGTNSFTITRWERGRAFPSPFYVEKLVAIFGQSAEILGLIPGPEPQALLPSLWQVPYPRNPHFTGRVEMLDHRAARDQLEETGCRCRECRFPGNRYGKPQ